MASLSLNSNAHGRTRPVPSRSRKSYAIAQRILSAQLSLAALEAEDAAADITLVDSACRT